jgi:hypothetical protein
MVDGVPIAPVDIENAAIGGANGGALKDPYLEGEDDAGKVLIRGSEGLISDQCLI